MPLVPIRVTVSFVTHEDPKDYKSDDPKNIAAELSEAIDADEVSVDELIENLDEEDEFTVKAEVVE